MASVLLHTHLGDESENLEDKCANTYTQEENKRVWDRIKILKAVNNNVRVFSVKNATCESHTHKQYLHTPGRAGGLMKTVPCK